jgi:hypothetical protein
VFIAKLFVGVVLDFFIAVGGFVLKVPLGDHAYLEEVEEEALVGEVMDEGSHAVDAAVQQQDC